MTIGRIGAIGIAWVLLALVHVNAADGQNNEATADLVHRIEQRMVLDKQVAGEFEQKKFVSVLPQPLESHGTFTYAPEDGLVWNTLGPVANRLEFDEQGIRQAVDGETVWSMDTEQPAVTTITRVISSVLAGDWRALQAYFHLAGEINREGWTLQLEPGDETMEQVIDSISVRGNRTLSKMTLREPNGDRTVIAFAVDGSVDES